MIFLQSRLGLRLALVITLLLTTLLLASFFWLDSRSNALAMDEEEARVELAAKSLVASLSSIMLSGHGDIAHDWLERVSAVSGFESARIFRTDGKEAFRDLETLNKVNSYLGEKRFEREISNASYPVSPEMIDSFEKATEGQVGIIHSKERGLLTYLYPIKAEDACMGCHGYNDSPQRGVLMLGISTGSALAAVSDTKRGMMGMFALIALLLGSAVWLAIRREVLVPIDALRRAADKIRQGDLSGRVAMEREDELGMVAAAFDLLVSDLSNLIDHERAQRRRQESITDAVISLGREAASKPLLKHIGRISMEVTSAPYAMLSFIEGGKKHFISQGLSPDEEALISHMPEGKGLLGVLWDEGKTLRIDNIASHPKSVGFPSGHVPMGSFLGTPIRFESQILGVIYLAKDPGSVPFTDEDEESLILLASACAIALSNTQQHEEVERINKGLEKRVGERTRELAKTNKQLKVREIELELTNEELVTASRAKDQFLANTSHELRTPLNAIIGFSELLTDSRTGSLSTKQKRYTDHISTSGKRLLTIINDLLDISKIESGMMEIHEVQCSPSELGRQVVAELKPLADAKEIKLTLSKLVADDIRVQADRDKLHQILVNLIGNAIKFTPENGMVELGVFLKDREESGQESVLVGFVHDNGIGISEYDRDKIFEPFTQSDGGLGRAQGGTGLGLTLSRRMVHLLGGSIQLESEVGKGSTFTIEIPVITLDDRKVDETFDSELEAEHVRVSPVVVEESMPDEGPKPLILIVDHNIDRAHSAAGLFSGEGYETVLTEMTNVEGVAREVCPFLIVMGVPDEAGETYNNLHLLKSYDSTSKIPTVLLGGDKESQQFSMGTIGRIEKGLGKNDLLEMVSHYGVNMPQSISVPTVLVIDDEVSVREYLKETLVPEGFHVILAANGDEGVRLAIERDPNLIILDLMMPGTTGFDVVEKLRHHPTACDIPVVVFTAKDLSREEALMLGQDVERVLLKGGAKKADVLQQLHKLEILYPVQARLMDTKLGCFNQRYMNRRIEHEAARAKRYSHFFALISWEMDAFPNYCDKHGMRWGVAALKATVDTVHSIIRRGDILARLSENRFVLLLPGISTEGASRVAEKVRLRIRQQRLPLPNGKGGKLTASLGVVHSSQDCEEPDELMKALKKRVEVAILEGGDISITEE